MSSKTKIVVFHMKELIYTAIFVGLAILFIILMVCMFDKKGDDKKTKETMKYQAGVYTSSILFNDNVLDVEVAVDEKKIKSISLVNLDESTATMYPLVEPALESLSEQIYKKQSLENITYSEENQYTSMVLDQCHRGRVRQSRSKKVAEAKQKKSAYPYHKNMNDNKCKIISAK